MNRNLRTGLIGAAAVCGMTGLGFASVPLYRVFCAATGLNGTTNRGDEAPGATGQKITVSFDSNIAPGLAWEFEPELRSETIDIGARDLAFFKATNDANVPITGRATFNVTPAQAGKYFTKIECFCFTEQTLQPGETVRMPVIFFVDPAIRDDPDAYDVENITLSYTFYPVDSDETTG